MVSVVIRGRSASSFSYLKFGKTYAILCSASGVDDFDAAEMKLPSRNSRYFFIFSSGIGIGRGMGMVSVVRRGRGALS
jgi:hypothetical protein